MYQFNSFKDIPVKFATQGSSKGDFLGTIAFGGGWTIIFICGSGPLFLTTVIEDTKKIENYLYYVYFYFL